VPRNENPIDRSAGPLAELACDLRELRATARLTYERMEQLSGLSDTTLSKAANGVDLPKWTTVVAYVTVCGGEPEQWRERYVRAQTGGKRTPGLYYRPQTSRRLAERGQFPEPYKVITASEFIDCLNQVRAWARWPSLREITALSGGRLPFNSVRYLLNREGTMPRWEQVELYLNALGAEQYPESIEAWREAWQRAALEEDRRGRNPSTALLLRRIEDLSSQLRRLNMKEDLDLD